MMDDRDGDEIEWVVDGGEVPIWALILMGLAFGIPVAFVASFIVVLWVAR